MYYIDNFKKQTEPLYYLKDKEYLEKIKCHLQIVSSLFVNKGILIYLTSDNYSELINRTLYLKRIIRKKYGFTESRNFYVRIDDNNYHMNLLHCPDAISSLFDKDLNYLNTLKLKELNDDEINFIKKHKTFEL